MAKKSAARQKKVNAAVRILETTTGVKVPQAMNLAGFSKSDIASKSVRRMRPHCLQAKQTTHRCTLTLHDIEVAANGSDVSPLTGDGDDEHMKTTMHMAPSLGPTHPKT